MRLSPLPADSPPSGRPESPGRLLPAARHLFTALILITALWTTSARAVPSPDNPPKNVLVLSSYHLGYTWGETVINGIRPVLTDSGMELKVRYEFMDTKHYTADVIFDGLRELYRKKYRNVRFDVIIASDNNALNFLLESRDELFPGAPVVFCGINGYEDAMIAGHRGFTGIAEDYELRGTLNLALSLHPGIENIAVVSGVTTSSLINQRRVREVMPEFTDRVGFLLLTGLNVPEMRERLQNLPPRTLVLYMSYYLTPDGTTLTVPESTSFVFRTAGVPIYSVWTYTLGYGILGGKMLDGGEQGRYAAEIALRILRGESPDDIPVLRNAVTRPTFDYNQLRHFGIPFSDLPPGAVIANEPETLYYRYKRIIWAVGVFIAYQFLTILFLLHIIARRKRAEKALLREEARLEALLEISTMQDGPPERLTRFALEKAVELTGSHVGYLVLFEDSGQVERVVCLEYGEIRDCELPPPPGTAVRDDAGSGKECSWPESWLKAMGERRAVRVPKLTDEAGEAWPCAQSPVTRHLIEPLVDGEQLVGLVIVCNKPVRFNEADTRQLTLLAQGILQPLQRRRAQAREAQLAEELRHAQKMEAIGTFAGGIAHDFNNILGAIATCTEIAIEDVPRHDPVSEDLHHIFKAAQRGRNLVRRILAFSRKSDPSSEPVQLKAVVTECTALLKTVIPPTVSVRLDVRTSSALVLADPTQLHQVVMNLCTNAEQSMRGGKGELTITLDALDLDETDTAAMPDLSPGRYARITVTDTGPGMDEAVISRIFDPFFTTRKQSGGTGLGLSMTHGIVKRHGGNIAVESAPGRGSTFRVYLPCAHGGEILASPGLDACTTGGSERILLVDDDEDMLYSVNKLLRKRGYAVDTRPDGAAGLEAFRAGNFDLVITDHMMPVMTGIELAGEIQELDNKGKSTPVLLYTGFGDDDVASMTPEELHRRGVHRFLTKPFAVEDLCSTVRDLLDGIDDRS